MRGLWLCALCSLLACGDSDAADPVDDRLGLSCDAFDPCPEGSECLEELAYCSIECSQDADCADLQDELAFCGRDFTGRAVCMNRDCAGIEYRSQRYVCADDKPQACENLDDSYCYLCGCDDGMYCADGGCHAQAQLGQACTEDVECTTGHCSAIAGVCRTQLGGPCDGTNCDSCLMMDGFSYCSRECDSLTDCPSGSVCIGDIYELDVYHCYPACSALTDGRCPMPCSTYQERGSIEDSYFCQCPDCTVASVPRELGQACSWNDECISGRCELEPQRCESGVCTRNGLCGMAE